MCDVCIAQYLIHIMRTDIDIDDTLMVNVELVVDSSMRIDVLVASFCTENDCALLHRDRDNDAFEHRRGLHGWRH